MICKLCGKKMWSEGGISQDTNPPVHNDRYDCPSGHMLWITYGEDTPRSEQWLDEHRNVVIPPAANESETP